MISCCQRMPEASGKQQEDVPMCRSVSKAQPPKETLIPQEGQGGQIGTDQARIAAVRQDLRSDLSETVSVINLD